MAGIFVPNPSTSALTQVRDLFVADDNAQYQQVKAAWVADPANGNRYTAVWPAPPDEVQLAIATTGDWRQWSLSWGAVRGTDYRVEIITASGITVLQGAGSGTSTLWAWFNTVGVTPGSNVTIRVSATNASGSVYKDFTAVTPPVPAPVNLRVVSTDFLSGTLAWDALPGVAAYQVLDARTGSVITTVAGLSAVLSLSAKTSYSFAVRAQAQSPANPGTWLSGQSAPVSFTTPAAPGTTPGVYTIKPFANATWQSGESGGFAAAWRPTTDELYHGDAGAANDRGIQTAHFFYGSRIADAFAFGTGGLSVTRFQVWLLRGTQGGSSSGSTSRWQLHKFLSKPGAGVNPADNWSTYVDVGFLGLNEGAWIDLPTHWGQRLIDADLWRGIAWGNVAGRYMQADSNLSLTTPNGTLRITLG